MPDFKPTKVPGTSEVSLVVKACEIVPAALAAEGARVIDVATMTHATTTARR